MSLRDTAMAHRINALEEAVEALTITIRSHLPSASGMAENAMSAIENARAESEKVIARAVSANRVTRALQNDRPLQVGELNTLLSIYLPLLEQHDADGKFFRKIGSHGPYSYSDDPYQLDLSRLALNAYLSQPHTGGVPHFDSTRLTLHINKGPMGGWRSSAISGTEIYQGEWVDYAVEYDGLVAPLGEREFIHAMREIFRDLDVPEAFIDPHFELQGPNGVVHALTLSHHGWRRDPKILGESVNGRGVVLKPRALPKNFGCGIRITLWTDDPTMEVEIQLSPGHSTAFRLEVPRDSQKLSLRRYGANDQELRPSDLSILERARLKQLVMFVVSILDRKREDLIFRDPTGVTIDWELETMVHPDDV